ncbi:hypothetical protein ACQ5SP_06880 [Rhodovulum sp. YNF3179]
MIGDIRKILTRSPGAVMEDAAGCAALAVLVMLGLYLPGLV